MPGVLIRYLVKVGDPVTRGTPVVVLEAMKMENTLTATADGRIKALPLAPGEPVQAKQALVIIG